MKIQSGFIKREVGGRTIAVAVGERSKTFNGMVTLNGVAGFIWDLLQEDTDEETIVSAVLKEYDADEQTVRADVSAFIGRLRDEGLLDE